MNNMDFETRKSETIYINPLSLTQLTGAIYMFSYGLTFAFVTFIFECIGGKYFCKENFETWKKKRKKLFWYNKSASLSYFQLSKLMKHSVYNT